MKKVWILLCAVFLLAMSAGTVHAAEEEQIIKDQNLVYEAEQLYKTCRRVSGRSTFQGYCGLMTSYQLWQLGINENLIVCDGNKQFDYYKDLKVTTGGHTVRAYSAEDYSLSEALNLISANGKKDVRNILVGFQWTSTNAGHRYGHACVINAIENGLVYFTESFDYAMGHMEGKAIVCTIAQFEEFFADWTTYEGVVYFGTEEYAHSCLSYGTDVYLQVRFDSNLRSQPCLVGENDCRRVRSLKGGETLHATGVYESEDGDLFYQVLDGDGVAYVSANAVFTLQPDEAPASLTYARIPNTLAEGKKLELSGLVRADSADICALELELTDGAGNSILTLRAEDQADPWDLDMLNDALKEAEIPVGGYCLRIYAEVDSTITENGTYAVLTQRQELCREILTVGNAEPIALTPVSIAQEGWFTYNNTWYYYQDGKAYSGWITRVGVDYFLQSDGSVTTGWAEIEGVKRYFSATGALCHGWVTTNEGVYYWHPDGTMAVGMQPIDGSTYFFDTEGLLKTEGTVTWEGVEYLIAPDGLATVRR